MKILALVLGATKGALIVPGVFKVDTPNGSDINPVVICNNIPNQGHDDEGGWNYMFTDGSDLVFSQKDNPLYDVATDPAIPGLDAKLPVNYLTADDAVAGYEAEEYDVVIS